MEKVGSSSPMTWWRLMFCNFVCAGGEESQFLVFHTKKPDTRLSLYRQKCEKKKKPKLGLFYGGYILQIWSVNHITWRFEILTCRIVRHKISYLSHTFTVTFTVFVLRPWLLQKSWKGLYTQQPFVYNLQYNNTCCQTSWNKMWPALLRLASVWVSHVPATTINR